MRFVRLGCVPSDFAVPVRFHLSGASTMERCFCSEVKYIRLLARVVYVRCGTRILSVMGTSL